MSQSGGAVPANLAEPVPRIIAGLIDYGIAYAILIVGIILGGAIGDAIGALLTLVAILGSFAFFIWNVIVQQGNTGQSIGKKQQNLRVVSEQTGQPLGVGPSVVRFLVHYFIDGICLLGYIYGLFINPKKQTVGDIAAKSLVVNA
jgi:uncharacterized RDD family membrane protein YckC